MEFTLNGRRETTGRSGRLIDYLRNEKGLTSVKNGCSTGVCGSCTVLVDGQPKRACKGIGEVSTIPTTAAVACAYYARDKAERLSLPLAGTPYARTRG